MLFRISWRVGPQESLTLWLFRLQPRRGEEGIKGPTSEETSSSVSIEQGTTDPINGFIEGGSGHYHSKKGGNREHHTRNWRCVAFHLWFAAEKERRVLFLSQSDFFELVNQIKGRVAVTQRKKRGAPTKSKSSATTATSKSTNSTVIKQSSNSRRILLLSGLRGCFGASWYQAAI